MRNMAFGYLMAVFTIMMWSMNIIYAKYLAGILSPYEISFYRWFVALFIMIPISYKTIKQEWKKLLKHWKFIALMSLTGMGTLNLFVYYAGHTASATDMSLISILGPIFLIILSRQKIDIFQFTGICLAILGVMIIILHGNFKNLATFKFVSGDLFMLGSSFLFAVYSLAQKKSPQDVHSTSLLTAAITLTAIAFFFMAIPQIIHTPTRSIPKIAWGVLLLLGIINSALAYLSWDIVIKKIGVINAGTIYYTMPIFSITSAYFLLHEQIYTSQIFGAMIIVVGILCVVFGVAKSQAKNASLSMQKKQKVDNQ